MRENNSLPPAWKNPTPGNSSKPVNARRQSNKFFKFDTNLKITNQSLLIISIAGAMAASLRCRDWAWQSIWAEDGSIFYQQSISMGFTEYFTTPYAGYYFTLHRFLTWPAHYFPINTLGFYFFIISAMNYVIMFYIISKALNQQYSSKFILFVPFLVALLPPAAGETLQNINNLQWFWYIAWAACTVLPWSASQKFRNWYWISSLLLALSAPAVGPMLVLGFMFKVGVFARELIRSSFETILILITIVACSFQLFLVFVGRIEQTGIQSNYILVADLFYRLVGTSFLGGITFLYSNKLISLLAILAMLMLLQYLVSIAKFIFRSRKESFVLCVLLFVPTLMGMIASIRVFKDYAFSNPLLGGRYFVTSAAAIVFLLLFSYELQLKKFQKISRVILTVILTVSVIVNFATNQSRSRGDFSDEVAKMKTVCLEKPNLMYSLPITPENWVILIACRDVNS